MSYADLIEDMSDYMLKKIDLSRATPMKKTKAPAIYQAKLNAPSGSATRGNAPTEVSSTSKDAAQSIYCKLITSFSLVRAVQIQ